MRVRAASRLLAALIVLEFKSIAINAQSTARNDVSHGTGGGSTSTEGSAAEDAIAGCWVQAAHIANANDPPCREGARLPVGSACTPQCAPGHVVEGPGEEYAMNEEGRGFAAVCTSSGRLEPHGFICRPWRCSLPTYGTWWSATLPTSPAEDYAAEPQCESAAPEAFASGGQGCATCYGPPLEVVVSPAGGLDVGGAAAIVLKFEGRGQRRLVFHPVMQLEVTWGRRNGSGAVITQSKRLSAFDFELSDHFRQGPRATELGQLDSGPHSGGSGLEVTRSQAKLMEPLMRPAGMEVLQKMNLTVQYVIAGCRSGKEGAGSVKFDLQVWSGAYNLSSCEAAVAPSSAESSLHGCEPSCLPHFRGSALAVCPEDGGVFQLEGCMADCAAPEAYDPQTHPEGVLLAMEPSCLEGSWIAHHSACTARCEAGWTAVPMQLTCADGAFAPETFHCHVDCDASGMSGPHVAAIPCEELHRVSMLPHGGVCTPVCVDGFHPVPREPLRCSDGVMSPQSFACHPLFTMAMETVAFGGRRSAMFRGPDGVVYFVGASAERLQIEEVAEPVGHMIISQLFADPLVRGQWTLRESQRLGVGAHDIRVVAVDADGSQRPRLMIIATGSHSSHVFAWHAQNRSAEWVQQLGSGNVGSRAAVASVNGSATVFTTSDTANSIVFAWNGSHFAERQRLQVSASVLLPFTLGGTALVFALSRAMPSRMYKWFHNQSAADQPMGDFAVVGSYQTPAASAAAWLGCYDDPAFANHLGQPCHRLPLSACAEDEAVKHSCGSLCGCGHEAPLLALAVTYPVAQVLIWKVGPEGMSVQQLFQIQAVGPVYDLCSMFVPTHDRLYLVAATGPPPGEAAAPSAVFEWRESRARGGYLELVQNIALETGSKWPRAVDSCAALPGQNTSLLFLGTAPVAGVPADSAVQPEELASRLFAVEGAFGWTVSDWGECSRACLDSAVGQTSVQRRNVSCVSQPGRTAYDDSFCAGAKPSHEATCQVPLCAKPAYEWTYSDWGDCDRGCGVGARHRASNCRLAGTANHTSLHHCDPALRPSANKMCSLPPCASYRLVNRVAVLRSWQVVELQFYVDDSCTRALSGRPFSSGSCEDCHCRDALGVWGGCDALLAFDGHFQPQADDELNAGTAWISRCGSGSTGSASTSCGPGRAWLGMHVDVVEEIRCVRIWQSGDVAYSAAEVALESWEHAKARWESVAEWASVPGGRWERLEVPRLCNDNIDCRGHGRAQGLPGNCFCICNQGYHGPTCGYCASDYEGYPACRRRPVESNAWRIVALSPAPSGHWHVADLTLHTAIACDSDSGVPAHGISQYLFSHGDGIARNVSTNTSLGPARAFDSTGVHTVWASPCGGGYRCPSGDSWLGVQLHNVTRVQCLRLHQGSSTFAVDTIGLDVWVAGTSTWQRVREWSGLILQGQTAGATDGKEMGMTALRIQCDKELPAGQAFVTNCGESGIQPWDECMAWCKDGYSGEHTTYVCQDDYTFNGLQPECTPKQCSNGLPVSNAIVVDDCVGKFIEETCIVTCMEGFEGTPVTYICAGDGFLRELRTRQLGVLPLCSRINSLGQVETTSSSVRVGIGMMLCCGSLFMTLPFPVSPRE